MIRPSCYYRQPLVHCYLMHAQWLASEAREHSGDKAEFGLWQKVVEASIQASANAQNHLLSMQEPDPARRGAGSAHRCKTWQPEQASQQPPMPDKAESLPWASLAVTWGDTPAAENLPHTHVRSPSCPCQAGQHVAPGCCRLLVSRQRSGPELLRCVQEGMAGIGAPAGLLLHIVRVRHTARGS
jgi:hypothetical protein